jgi:hypothetical protein
MKYLCLIYVEESIIESMSEAEMDALLAEHRQLDEALLASGQQVASEALQLAETAVTVRLRNGRTTVTDGPFAETKEQLGGFYLIEAADIDAATQIARRIPCARLGCVEVRPVQDFAAP